jgi:hypothetical protein
MELKLVRHLWGVEKSWQEAFPQFKAEGYSMIEGRMPDAGQEAAFKELLAANGFGFVAMAFTGGADARAHVQSFREQLDQAVRIGASQLTVHSGSDAWGRSECDAFYSEVVRIEKDAPIPVAHETHRGRVFFNPWVTRDVLEKFESLKVCCDFSHWVCVAERLNWDDEAGSILKLCADRAFHLHSRVGYEEGPQVPDPSAPEYARHLEAHLSWWDAVWASQRARGMKVSTLTPEFGPPGYMHTLPHTNVPVADLWRVCNWIAEKAKTRFENRA